MKKLLIPLFFLILFVPASAMAYPVQFGSNAAQVIYLKDPTISIDTSSFEQKNLITVSVEFENKSTTYDGLIWNTIHISNLDNMEQSLEDIFNAPEHNNRLIGLEIDGLDYSLFKVTSDYNLIATVNPENGLQNTFQLEILDIEQNVKGDNSKSSFEFEFELSSPEFELGKEYDLELYVPASGETTETFELVETVVDIPVVETPEEKPEIKKVEPEKTIPVETSLGIASFVDKSKDPQYYVDRYNNEPAYKKWFDDNYSQYDSIYQAVGLDESKVSAPVETKTTEVKCGRGMVAENGICVITEQITPADPQCGQGTELVNGFCKVIQTTESEKEGFLDSFMKIFRDLFN